MFQLLSFADSSLASALPGLSDRFRRSDAPSAPIVVLSDDSPANDLAKDYHTTFVRRNLKALFYAYDKQVERRKFQDTNLLILIMLYLTRASTDRLKFEFTAQYAAVGTSGITPVKLLLISHRPPPRLIDRIIIATLDNLTSRRQDGTHMDVPGSGSSESGKAQEAPPLQVSEGVRDPPVSLPVPASGPAVSVAAGSFPLLGLGTDKGAKEEIP